MLRKFSPSEVEEIFYKAAAIDLELKDALSIEQLREIAFESGISTEALESAIEEVEAQQQLDLKPERKLQNNLKASSAKQKLTLLYFVGTFIAGRLGILILNYIPNTQALFSRKVLLYKYFLGVSYVLKFELELITVLVALSFPFVLAFTLLKNNLQIYDEKA